MIEAVTLLQWAVSSFRGRVAVSVSFGGGGIVLAHMLSRIDRTVPVVFIDTRMHFPETLAMRDRYIARYGLNVVDIGPDQDPGPLYATDPAQCCDIRKVRPMRRALRDFDAWISALRRDQSATRASLLPVETHDIDQRALTKVHPLVSWTRADVRAYVAEHDLPDHPLTAQGYSSIGCWPCTLPTVAGESERAGRWRGRAKTECGLHQL